MQSDSDESQKSETKPTSLARQLKEVAITAAAKLTGS
jgi:protein-serine/threonine kinase